MLLFLILLMVTLLMLTMTFVEGMADGNRFDLPRILGLLACLVWPVSLPLLLLASGIHRIVSIGRLPRLTHHRRLMARSA